MTDNAAFHQEEVTFSESDQSSPNRVKFISKWFFMARAGFFANLIKLKACKNVLELVLGGLSVLNPASFGHAISSLE